MSKVIPIQQLKDAEALADTWRAAHDACRSRSDDLLARALPRLESQRDDLVEQGYPGAVAEVSALITDIEATLHR